MIKQFAELEGEQLTLTGGEPFLKRKLLYKIIEKAKEWGIKRVSVETNGTLITKKDASLCEEFGVTVGVSLDGATPESCDYVRGAGTFEKAIEAIKTLVEFHVNTNIAITFMRHNLGEAKEIVRLAKRLEASTLSLNAIRIIGRAKENKHLAVSPEETAKAYIKAWKAAKKIGVETSMEKQIADLKNLTKRDSCGAGTNFLSVTADGNVYPCNLLQEKEFVAGNVKTQNLREIWKTSTIIEDFRRLSILDIPKCRDCELRYICGWCPAESFLAYGTLRQRSPWCAFYKKICWSTIKELAYELWQEA